MLRTVRWTALLLTLCVGFGHAADEPKKESSTPAKEDPKVEKKTDELVVELYDKTTIRIVPLDKQLEVVTKYGKLTVPTGDIRRIEFGLHMSDEMSKQVEDTLKDLESTDFQTREAAAKKLVSLGRYSFPSVVKASKGANLETKRRLDEIVKDMRKKYADSQLKIRTDDAIYTRDFTIMGTITTPVLRLKNEHFGEASIKLSELRCARTVDTSGHLEVSVDAAKYGSAANQWMETEYVVENEMRLKITASGTVDVFAQAAGQYLSGPEGNNQLGQRGRFIPGQLVGKIGEAGQPFAIGANYEATVQQEGKLYLHIWPFQNGGGATGSFTVKIGSGN